MGLLKDMGFDVFILVVLVMGFLSAYLAEKSFPGLYWHYKLVVFLIASLGIATVLSMSSDWGQPLLKSEEPVSSNETWLKWLTSAALFVFIFCIYFPLLGILALLDLRKETREIKGIQALTPIKVLPPDAIGTPRHYEPEEDVSYAPRKDTRSSMAKKIGLLVALEVIANLITKGIIRIFSRLPRILKNIRRAK